MCITTQSNEANLQENPIIHIARRGPLDGPLYVMNSPLYHTEESKRGKVARAADEKSQTLSIVQGKRNAKPYKLILLARGREEAASGE